MFLYLSFLFQECEQIGGWTGLRRFEWSITLGCWEKRAIINNNVQLLSQYISPCTANFRVIIGVRQAVVSHWGPAL